MLSYFIAAARSHSSRQSRASTDQVPNPRVVTQAPSKEEKGDLRQGNVWPGSRTIASLDKGSWRQCRRFPGASACKVEKMQFSSHTWTFKIKNFWLRTWSFRISMMFFHGHLLVHSNRQTFTSPRFDLVCLLFWSCNRHILSGINP